jgi:hypothetical protein
LGVRDTDSANPSISDAQYNAFIDSAITAIAADTEYYEASDSITGDGTNYSFTLVGTGSGNVAANYLSARSFYYLDGAVIDGAVPIEEIRAELAAGNIIVGEPTKYALFGGKVFFDRIPASGTVIYCDYHAVPAALSADNSAPESPLHLFEALIVARTLVEIGSDMGLEDIAIRGATIYAREKPKFVHLIENGGKHQTLGSSIRRSRL